MWEGLRAFDGPSLKRKLVARRDRGPDAGCAQLEAASVLLLRLCQQLTGELLGRASRSPAAWHHKLLHASLSTLWQQPPWQPLLSPSVSPEEVIAACGSLSERLSRAMGAVGRLETALAPQLEKVGPSLASPLESQNQPIHHLLPQDGIAAFDADEFAAASCEVLAAVLGSSELVHALESCSGCASAAELLLPSIDCRCHRYMITDSSVPRLEERRACLATFTSASFGLLDLGSHPRMQGYASSQFDLLVAAHALHRPPDLRLTLRSVKELLRGGGLLAMAELTQLCVVSQVSEGLAAEWWAARDGERLGQQSPLLSVEQWRRLLLDSGFAEAIGVARSVSSAMPKAAVLFAQVGHRAQGIESAGASCSCWPSLTTLLPFEGSLLISGGLGGLGLLTARLCADHGAQRIVLGSRSGSIRATSSEDHKWTCARTNVRHVLCDWASWQDVSALARQLGACGRPIGGVFHSAGILADGALAEQSAASLRAVLRPKLVGAVHIHAAVAQGPIHIFSVYASIVGLLGNHGQAPHAAASSWLDSFAHYRRGQSLCAQSVEWGYVAEVGVAARPSLLNHARRSGFGTVSRELVCSALEHLTPSGLACVAVLPADWVRLLSRLPVVQGVLLSARAWATSQQSAVDMCIAFEGLQPLWAHAHVQPPTRRSTRSPVGSDSLAKTASSAETAALLRSCFLQACGLPPPDADTPLFEAGVDSLLSIELRNVLQLALGSCPALPGTLVFAYPTLRQLTRFIRQRGADSSVAVAASAVAAIAAVRVSSGFGLVATRWANGVRDARPVWRVHSNGGSVIGQVPPDRWEVGSASAEGEAICSCLRHGGFCHGADLFNNRFFSINDAEASSADPQQRLLLEGGYEALHSASQTRASLLDQRVGVFVGICHEDFRSVARTTPSFSSTYASTGYAHSVASGRLSFAFGLHGNSAAYDSACSSTHTAAHAAHRALQLEECLLALLAGVNLMLTPEVALSFFAAKMLSLAGCCHTFDARADGFVRAEACCATALQPAAATAAVTRLLGIAVRQDGRSASLTAPNGQAQQLLLEAALADAASCGDELNSLQAHGTGTSLGDPIEVRAQSGALGLGRGVPLALHSMKANVGHSEPAAGLAGLQALAMTLQQATVLPNAQLRALNPHVGSAVHHGWSLLSVQLALPSVNAVGGVSSFGYSGTIAHAIAQAAANACCGPCTCCVLCPSAAGVFRRRSFPWPHLPRSTRHSNDRIERQVPLIMKGLHTAAGFAQEVFALLDTNVAAIELDAFAIPDDQHADQARIALAAHPMAVIVVCYGQTSKAGLVVPGMATISLAHAQATFSCSHSLSSSYLMSSMVRPLQRKAGLCVSMQAADDELTFDAATALHMGLIDFVGTSQQVDKELQRLWSRLIKVQIARLVDRHNDSFFSHSPSPSLCSTPLHSSPHLVYPLFPFPPLSTHCVLRLCGRWMRHSAAAVGRHHRCITTAALPLLHPDYCIPTTAPPPLHHHRITTAASLLSHHYCLIPITGIRAFTSDSSHQRHLTPAMAHNNPVGQPNGLAPPCLQYACACV